MFKKVLLIIFFMYVLVGAHAQAPKKGNPLSNNSNFHLYFYNQTNIAFAAEKDENTANKRNKVENSFWSSYILPGTVGIILILGIGSYWLVFRKNQLKKEA